MGGENPVFCLLLTGICDILNSFLKFQPTSPHYCYLMNLQGNSIRKVCLWISVQWYFLHKPAERSPWDDSAKFWKSSQGKIHTFIRRRVFLYSSKKKNICTHCATSRKSERCRKLFYKTAAFHLYKLIISAKRALLLDFFKIIMSVRKSVTACEMHSYLLDHGASATRLLDVVEF